MEKEKVNIVSIPPDKAVDLKIGGLFYQRLNKLLIEYANAVSKKHLVFAVDLIKRDKADKDNFAYNFETLVILLRDIENAFKDAGLTVDNEIEIEKFKDVDDESKK